MNVGDLSYLLLSYFLSLAFLGAGIPLAKRYGWVDHPSSRRRHREPMPMVGGISVMLACAVTGLLYLALHPGVPWAASYAWILGGAAVLCVLGLFDDLRGLGPGIKLPVEFTVVMAVIAFVPEIQDFCRGWEPRIGFFAWPLAAIWIVGVSNAVNLVDGLDGLAGGISAFILLSLGALALIAGEAGQLSLLLAGTLLPAVLAFLLKNWSPARVFLGDNGSLPIGFLIGTLSLAGPVSTGSYSEVLGLLTMVGYPILDMGLCTLRRFRTRNPIFKADRGHLHHRLLRMNLTPARVVTLILALTLYLQASAFLITLLARSESFRVGFSLPAAVALLLVAVAAGIYVPVHFLSSVERSLTGNLADSLEGQGVRLPPALGFQSCLVARVQLDPLLQSGLWEERRRIGEIMRSLHLVVESMLDKSDSYFVKNSELQIFFEGKASGPARLATMRLLRGKLRDFQALFGLQYSSSDLNIDWEVQEVLAAQSGSRESDYLFQLAHADDYEPGRSSENI